MDEHRQLHQISRTRALELLGSVSVGRIVFSHHALPAIRPVNHLVECGSIIVRATAGAAITSASRNGVVVAYEADSIDSDSHVGWSVIVLGTARLLTDDAAAARYRMLLQPWISGKADDVITISTDLVTGYEMVADEPADGLQRVPATS